MAMPELYARLFSASETVILIPLCFVLTHFPGFKGVYLSEGIADFIAGVITAIVIFTSLPRIFRKRGQEVRARAERHDNSF